MDLDQALSLLLEWPPPSDDEELMEHALIDAVKESQRRRRLNSAAGGAVIAELVKRPGWSYTRIENECGIPRGTAHRWANPPEES